MVATGRVPNTKTLGLENMGIETFRGFVQVRTHSTRPASCVVCVLHVCMYVCMEIDPPHSYMRNRRTNRWTRRCAC